MFRRIVSDEYAPYQPPSLETLKAIAIHINLDFDVYSAGRMSAEDMKWDHLQEKDGKRFRIRYD